MGSTPKVGGVRTIRINPKDPKEFYDSRMVRMVISAFAITGLAFIVPVVVVLSQILAQKG